MAGLRALFVAAVALVVWSFPVRADENKLFTPDYFRRVGRDLAALPGTIAGWTGGERALAVGAAAVTWGTLYFDGEARESIGRQHPKDILGDFSASYTHFGDYRYLLPLIGGTWVAGLATSSDCLNKIAADTTEASFISAGLVNPALAFATGRALPSANENPNRFEPFKGGRYSFPSGHTSAAFAVASAIDVDLREKFGYWQTPVVYGVAAAVGTSRVYDHKHYPSEVFLGAVIGTSVGRWVANRPRNASVSASVSPAGLRLAWKFR